MAGLVSPLAPIDPVLAELRRWASEPFDLAGDNCGLAVLRYASATVGATVPVWLAVRLVGRCAARRLMRSRRAFVETSSLAMDLLGCPPTAEPKRGDVGLVDLDETGLTACLCLGDGRWASRGDQQVMIQSAEPLCAWSVSCPRP